MKENSNYKKFMKKAEFDKALNSLLGLVEGITIDKHVNDEEIGFLQAWLDDHRINANKHPFTEIFPVLEQAISDGIVTDDEKEDIAWLCRKLTSDEYFNSATADMQRLHAIVAGIAADGKITVTELNGLLGWMQEHEHLRKCWPYDEIESPITSTLKDQHIDTEEHQMLMRFFGEFVSILDNKTIVNPVFLEGTNIVGLCAVCPEISFADAVFCLTGTSHKYSRNEFDKIISSLGGETSGSVSKKVNYLIVGADGNPCWACACYGRKVEKAVELRKQGHNIMIIHEIIFMMRFLIIKEIS